MFQKSVIVTASLFILVFASFGLHAESLWPPSEPYRTGYFKVSAIHEIFYQLGGNPQGKPVMVLHGGPGGACSPYDFRYFNPEKFHVILHDQRGAGRSRPYAELRGNTTRDLVEDIEKLRRHLQLGRIILFGGSWGSTLALAYAETYPQNVSGMVLRGVFTATREEIDHFYHGGAGKFFPREYAQLAAELDQPEKKNYPQQLLAKLQSTDPGQRDRVARAWARYEGKLAFLQIGDEEVEGFLSRFNPHAFALIENHYMANDCFLQEGELLARAERLAGIPAVIVNGRFDVICPPVTAFRLHRMLPKSTLRIVERAGHSASDPAIEAELVKAAGGFED